MREGLRTRGLSSADFPELADVVIVPMGDVNRCSLQALKYAKRLSTDVRSIFVATSQAGLDRFHMRWNRFPDIVSKVNLIALDYDYRDILIPLVAYIEKVNHEEFPNQLVTVVIPEFVSNNAWENLLHNQTAHLLRGRLQAHKDIVIIDVPYQIGQQRALEARQQNTEDVQNNLT